jgi:hypothetical protein
MAGGKGSPRPSLPQNFQQQIGGTQASEAAATVQGPVRTLQKQAALQATPVNETAAGPGAECVLHGIQQLRPVKLLRTNGNEFVCAVVKE